MEKAHLVAQPFQLIAQQRREAYQWQRQRKRFADEGDAIPPVGRSPLHPLADKEYHWGTLCFKERAALSCKTSPVACKARVRQVKHGPILAWYLCLFVQQWSWRGRCKEN